MCISKNDNGGCTGCKGMADCPLTARMRRYELDINRMEQQLDEVCSRIGQVFRDIADSLQGVVVPTLAAAPLATMNMEDKLRDCIQQLVEARDARGRFLVSRKSQWQAVYRILADRGLGVADGDYAGFERLVWRIQPAGCRVPFSLSALKQITKTNFTRPFARWTFDPAYFKTRRPYDEMVAVATRFCELIGDGSR